MISGRRFVSLRVSTIRTSIRATNRRRRSLRLCPRLMTFLAILRSARFTISWDFIRTTSIRLRRMLMLAAVGNRGLGRAILAGAFRVDGNRAGRATLILGGLIFLICLKELAVAAAGGGGRAARAAADSRTFSPAFLLAAADASRWRRVRSRGLILNIRSTFRSGRRFAAG